MDDAPITRAEHEEFAKRIDEENNRQNRRIEILETNIIEMGELTTTVAKLAINLESMIEAQKKQDARITTLEGRDGERWRSIVSHVATTVIGIVISYIFIKLGM